MNRAHLTAEVIAVTTFVPPGTVPWQPDESDPDGCALIEFAGRACYQSWTRPNQLTATNTGYIEHILKVKHLSVLEHANVTFYITGISRSLSHEMVRHRHLSFSQLSQRYVPEQDAAMVVPPDLYGDRDLMRWFEVSQDSALSSYGVLLSMLQKKFADITNATLRRKKARQAARSVLPNATETKLVVTGNYRAWRHFITMRATEHADVEIRELAIWILRQLWDVAPAVFCDFEIYALDDGTEVAKSRFSAEE